MTIILLSIVGFAGLIHAGFALSVSALSLMSGHALGRKTSHARLVRMTWAYTLGSALFTTLLLASAVLFVRMWLLTTGIPMLVWAALAGALIGLGLAVWSVYYRMGPGTALWVPHGVATYITKRAKSTKSSFEAFNLGMSTVVLELLFIAGPLLTATLLLHDTSAATVTVGIGVYALLSVASVIVVTCLIGSGRSISRIQKWRESNKRFLQFVSGAGLIVLGGYVYVEKVLGGIAL